MCKQMCKEMYKRMCKKLQGRLLVRGNFHVFSVEKFQIIEERPVNSAIIYSQNSG